MNMMIIPDAFCVFVGPTERNAGTDLLHCVVGRVLFKGEMQDKDHPIVHFETVHDPLPRSPGLLNGMPTEIGFLIPLKPHLCVQNNL